VAILFLLACADGLTPGKKPVSLADLGAHTGADNEQQLIGGAKGA